MTFLPFTNQTILRQAISIPSQFCDFMSINVKCNEGRIYSSSDHHTAMPTILYLKINI